MDPVLVIALVTVVLVALAGVIGGMGLLGGTETNSRHDHFLSRLIDWMF